MHKIDGPGATVDNEFTDGDPVRGIQATLVTDDWLNDVQGEIISVLEDQSITPVKGTRNQLLTAIKAIFAGIAQATETIIGVAKVSTQTLTDAGADDATIVTPKKLRNGFVLVTGAAGYVAFPSWLGGFVIQWTGGTTSVVASATINWPIPFPNAYWRHVSSIETIDLRYATSTTPTNVGISAYVSGSSTCVANTVNLIAIGR